MLFPFVCSKCKKHQDRIAPIGKPPTDVKCENCGGDCKRVYMATGIVVSGVRRPSSFGEQQKAKNEDAAYRMKGRKAPVRTVAYDHGCGDVREV